MSYLSNVSDAYGNVLVSSPNTNIQLKLDGYVSLKNLSIDPVFPTNYGTLYTKTDGKLYYNSVLGVEVVVGGTSSTGFINVKNAPYNAIGNGIADDFTPIQNAINDAYSSGLSVFIPEGTYFLNTVNGLTIPYNIEIYGVFNKSILTSTGGSFIFSISNVSNVYIHDLNFTTPDTVLATNGGIGTNTVDNLVIQRCKFSNFHYYGFRSSAANTKLLLIDNEASHIYRDVTSTGLDPAHCQNSIIARNYVHDISNPDTRSHAIYAAGDLSDVLITNNIIDNCTSGLEIGTSSGPPSLNVSVIGNIITNMGSLGIQIVNIYNASVTGNIVRPNLGGNGINIYETINFTVSGNTIVLDNLPFNSGANGIVVVNGSSNGNISGNTINRNDGLTRGCGIIIYEGSGYSVSGNVVTNLHQGIQLIGSDAYGVSQTVIYGNNFACNLPNVDTGGNVYTGIYLDGYVWGINVNNNVFNNFPYAFYLDTASGGVGSPQSIMIRNNMLFNVITIGKDTVASGALNVLVENNTMDSGSNIWVTNNPNNNLLFKNNRLFGTSFGSTSTVVGNAIDVSQVDIIEPTNGSTINNFINGYVGQVIKIKSTVSAVTISNNSNILLKNSINFNMLSGDTITLCQYNNGIWTEIGRTSGAIYAKLAAVSTTYTVASGDFTVAADATSGPFTVTLPDAISNNGRLINIKKIDSTSNSVTIGTTSSQTIDGLTTYIISSQYTSLSVQSNGSNWFII